MRKSIFTLKNEPPRICAGCKFFNAAPQGGWYCEKLKTQMTKDMQKAATCLFKQSRDDRD